MPEYAKPTPPYPVELPPRFANTPYDDLPHTIQERLDMVRIDTSTPIPEPRPDVVHPSADDDVDLTNQGSADLSETPVDDTASASGSKKSAKAAASSDVTAAQG